MTRPALLISVVLACVACSKSDDENNASHATPDADAQVRDATSDADAEPADVPTDVRPDARPDLVDEPVLGLPRPFPNQAGITPDGAADVESPINAEARAGRIQGATGFSGIWSLCKTGDFRLYNGLIEACISNERSARYETFAGGGLVDLRPVGHTGTEVFDMHASLLGLLVAHAEQVQVVRDGSDGGPAAVRVTGTDYPIGYLVGVLGPTLFRPRGLEVTVEYRLGPNADFIEVLTYVENPNDNVVGVEKGVVIGFGDRTSLFSRNAGFQAGGGPSKWIAAAGEGYSFAFVNPEEELLRPLGEYELPWQLLQGSQVSMQAGESYGNVAQIVVGDGDLDAVVRRARELIGEPNPALRTLVITDDAGNPVTDRRVEVLDAQGVVLAGGITDAAGQTGLSLPDGPARVRLQPLIDGSGADPVDITVSDAIAVTVPQPATVLMSATSGGQPIPVAVQGSWSDGVQQRSFETGFWGTKDRVDLIPGDWTFTASHGPEFATATQQVSVSAGQELTVSFDLAQLMDTSNWLAADFHQHMEPSSDSTVHVLDRVIDNAAQRVEIVVPTDHDVVTDLSPFIAQAGLTAHMATLPGVELSPVLAHTNVYPMAFELTAPGRGTIALSEPTADAVRRRSVPELIADARAMATDPVVQLNHPRDSSGLFELVAFDPELGPDQVDHNWWTDDFDAMEVSNGDECIQFGDWAGLWNAGIEPTPIGSSDSHGVWGDVGNQRTYLNIPAATPQTVTPEQVRDAVKDGAVSVGTSVFVDLRDGLPQAAVRDGSSGSVDVAVRVQSADWVAVDQIDVIVNGSIVSTLPVTSINATLDFDASITVPIVEDSWVVFFASGAPSGAVQISGKKPYAFANAVRVDFGGDGYTPPGVRAIELDNIALCQ